MVTCVTFLNAHPPGMETLAGVHHFYGGMGLALLGYMAVACCRRRLAAVGLAAVIAGALIMADDVWQHSVQYTRNENYPSPCKRVYRFIAPRCPLIRGTVVWADRFFRNSDSTDKKRPNDALQGDP